MFNLGSMGVTGGSKIFHKNEGVGLPQLAAVLRDLRPPVSNENQQQRYPCVVIDGNWIFNRVGDDSRRLVNLAEAFVAQGIDVFIVFDGFFRHHSKRISIKRSADAEKARIKAIQTRATLMQLREGGITTDVEKQREKSLSTRLKKFENQSQSNRFRPTFANAVVDAVDNKASPHIKAYIA